jgi:putative membrane-bound dehydrogenase-like protein
MRDTPRITTSILLLLGIVVQSDAALPRVKDDRYTLELVASEPEIVTPIGLAFDGKGRLLVVESHTHQRPAGYDGPAGDRIRMFADSDGDGRLDRWSTFAEGFRHAMNILVRADGGVYVVTRRSVVLLHDTDGDGAADKQDEILRLESEDDYPHNGLSGVAQAADGSLIIGLGENHGIAYRLTGSDGKTIADGGGQDGFFRCTSEGATVERFARGVWNPFGICVLPDGRVFAVDNDPDSSPPCRLLHVMPGGDYGYLYQYGRAGTHPLQAWDGELPGTLPMVCGTGEAPTALVPHAGSLWVTSWGDHRIERYRLVPRGASFTAERTIVVQGDADFRPTGMAVAADGSLYFGDWVRRDYEVHRQGRIWQLVPPRGEVAAHDPPPHAEPSEPDDDLEIDALLGSKDPFARVAAVRALAQRTDLANHPVRRSPHAKARLGWLEAMRWVDRGDVTQVLADALLDKSPEVRVYAVRWIADERITGLREQVAALLNDPPPASRYYLAVLGALDWLDRKPKLRGQGITDELLVRELGNSQRSPAAHALALQLLTPDHEFLTFPRLRSYLGAGDERLRLEAVRSLALKSAPERFSLLAQVAGDAGQPDSVRVEAIGGLVAAAEEYRAVLEQFAGGDHQLFQREAERVLRLAGQRALPPEGKPAAENLAEWAERLSKAGDAEAGRRLFFSAVGARCGVCHQHSGRGGRIGPDLTRIGQSSTRERIIASILQPSQEIAPHYQPWLLVTTDGKTHMGLRLPKAGDDGIELYAGADGKAFSLPSDSIEVRAASSTSIMPDGLQNAVSVDDLRDLATFLAAPAAE